MSKEEWTAIRSLADDRSIVKKADKGSFVVVWNRNDYVLEVEKQLSDRSVYRDVISSENILPKSLEVNNKYKKATNFGKLNLLPKIHKQLFDVPGKLVISSCCTPTKKCSEFLNYDL